MKSSSNPFPSLAVSESSFCSISEMGGNSVSKLEKAFVGSLGLSWGLADAKAESKSNLASPDSLKFPKVSLSRLPEKGVGLAEGAGDSSGNAPGMAPLVPSDWSSFLASSVASEVGAAFCSPTGVSKGAAGVLGVAVPLPAPLTGDDSSRDEDKDSDGSPTANVAWRFTVGVTPGGVPYDPTLADEVPVVWGLKEVGGGGVPEALLAPKSPKMSLTDRSP
jgi:hypothetical protein